MRHFRLQLIGGIVLHEARFRNEDGEEKNARRYVPAVLKGVAGRGVHFVTVADITRWTIIWRAATRSG